MSVLTSSTGPTPMISISHVGTQKTVTYTGVLQSSPDLLTPFADVPGATSPYVISGAAPARQFYRAR
ncbi:hypothetical protein [Luteolibacter sp. Populi]|uniref:hypothetical protein n=1 Tax=Luteolibacter sp. Populi TaxID=3230487 RepID=UPI0034662B5B